MISFRYHIVSIVAVFLALAAGIVVGTSALNGPITKDLRNQVSAAQAQRDSLGAQAKTLQGQVDNAGQFVTTFGSQLVANTLSGKSVVLLSLPGSTPTVRDAVTTQLAAAGAKITGQVSITSAYLDPSRGSEINTLATGPVRPVGWNAPVTGDAAKLGGSLLAWVLLGKGQVSDTKQVLSAFAEQRLITLQGNVAGGDSVVVLGGGTVTAGSYPSLAQKELVDALVATGGKIVVAGDSTSATGGGVVAAVRGSGARGGVSTVDDVTAAFGPVSTTLALAAANKGQTGHYGTQNGADALFPAPAR